MQSQYTPAQMRVLEVATSILETIQDFKGDGVPAGPMYAALMGRVTYDQFTSIMQILVDSGKIRHSNNQYFWNE